MKMTIVALACGEYIVVDPYQGVTIRYTHEAEEKRRAERALPFRSEPEEETDERLPYELPVQHLPPDAA